MTVVQTDMRRHGRQAGKDGNRFKPVQLMRAGSRRYEDAVGDGLEIKVPGFGGLRLPRVILEVIAGAGMRLPDGANRPADTVAMQYETQF